MSEENISSNDIPDDNVTTDLDDSAVGLVSATQTENNLNLTDFGTEVIFYQTANVTLNGTYVDEGRDDANNLMINVYLTPILIFFGIIGNIISIRVFSDRKFRNQSTSQYLTALAVSDTMFLLQLLPPWLNAVNVTSLFNRTGFCQFFMYISYVSCCMSAWLVVAFTAERFMVVLYPLQRQVVYSSKRARNIIAVLTVCAFLINIPVLKLVSATMTDCSVNNNYFRHASRFNLVDCLVSFTGPLLSTTAMNIGIIVGVVRLERQHAKLFRPELPTVAAMVRRAPRPSSRRLLACPRSQFKVTRMLLFVSTVFIVLNVPAYSLRLFAYTWDLEQSTQLGEIQQYSLLCFHTNYAINFLLYCLCGQKFRKTLWEIFPCKPTGNYSIRVNRLRELELQDSSLSRRKSRVRFTLPESEASGSGTCRGVLRDNPRKTTKEQQVDKESNHDTQTDYITLVMENETENSMPKGKAQNTTEQEQASGSSTGAVTKTTVTLIFREKRKEDSLNVRSMKTEVEEKKHGKKTPIPLAFESTILEQGAAKFQGAEREETFTPVMDATAKGAIKKVKASKTKEEEHKTGILKNTEVPVIEELKQLLLKVKAVESKKEEQDTKPSLGGEREETFFPVMDATAKGAIKKFQVSITKEEEQNIEILKNTRVPVSEEVEPLLLTVNALETKKQKNQEHSTEPPLGEERDETFPAVVDSTAKGAIKKVKASKTKEEEHNTGIMKNTQIPVIEEVKQLSLKVKALESKKQEHDTKPYLREERNETFTPVMDATAKGAIKKVQASKTKEEEQKIGILKNTRVPIVSEEVEQLLLKVNTLETKEQKIQEHATELSLGEERDKPFTSVVDSSAKGAIKKVKASKTKDEEHNTGSMKNTQITAIEEVKQLSLKVKALESKKQEHDTKPSLREERNETFTPVMDATAKGAIKKVQASKTKEEEQKIGILKNTRVPSVSEEVEQLLLKVNTLETKEQKIQEHATELSLGEERDKPFTPVVDSSAKGAIKKVITSKTNTRHQDARRKLSLTLPPVEEEAASYQSEPSIDPENSAEPAQAAQGSGGRRLKLVKLTKLFDRVKQKFSKQRAHPDGPGEDLELETSYESSPENYSYSPPCPLHGNTFELENHKCRCYCLKDSPSPRSHRPVSNSASSPRAGTSRSLDSSSDDERGHYVELHSCRCICSKDILTLRELKEDSRFSADRLPAPPRPVYVRQRISAYKRDIKKNKRKLLMQRYKLSIKSGTEKALNKCIPAFRRQQEASSDDELSTSDESQQHF